MVIHTLFLQDIFEVGGIIPKVGGIISEVGGIISEVGGIISFLHEYKRIQKRTAGSAVLFR
ncbi:hypothetical protein, partial [Bacillus salipaludis]